jgi:hypothetical protein
MRRPHLGGSLGAALLQMAVRRKWVTQDLDSRALALTALGRKEINVQFGLTLPVSTDPSIRSLSQHQYVSVSR